MGEDVENIPWEITMLGPTRVGKTSLIAALYQAGHDFFAGKPITVTADAITKNRILANDREMRGELALGRFSPGSLKGNSDSEINTLRISAPEDSSYELDLKIHDLPGGWIYDGTPEHEAEYQAALDDSQCVIIPIDATVLMHIDTEHMKYILELLRVDEVALFVRKWAKARRLRGEPARLILAPVKCESYFDDNGGDSDRAAELFGQVQWLYGDIVKTFRDEMGYQGLAVLYAPVDTIGPIYVDKVQWGEENAGEWETRDDGSQMRAIFEVRKDSDGNPAKRTIKGAEPILATLVSDATSAAERDLEQRLEYERNRQQGIEAQKQEKEANPILHFIYWLTKGKQHDIERLAALEENMRDLRGDLKAIQTGRESLSGEYARVRDWPA
jgi:GTPase SAR1 family protein